MSQEFCNDPAEFQDKWTALAAEPEEDAHTSRFFPLAARGLPMFSSGLAIRMRSSNNQGSFWVSQQQGLYDHSTRRFTRGIHMCGNINKNSWVQDNYPMKCVSLTTSVSDSSISCA